MLVKCAWCNEKEDKSLMQCEEKPTGKFNNNGTKKVTRKYFHDQCYSDYLKDKEFKEKEMKKLNELYVYICRLHGIKFLDPRQMEKIQDFRNGTVKINNKKIVKYKSGVSYNMMLLTYRHLETRIDEILKTMHFQTKWNEFSYIFGVMQNNLNDVYTLLKGKQKQEQLTQKVQQTRSENNVEDIQIKTRINKKDELDISNFL